MGQTPLHVAAIWGSVECMQALIATAKKRTVEACTVLLDAGADTHAADAMGMLPYERAQDVHLAALLGGPDPRLFQAALKGDAQELRHLVSALSSPSDLRVFDQHGRHLLNLAVMGGSLEAVEVMLAADAELARLPDMTGDTPLHVAVRQGKLEVVRKLLALQVPLNARNLRMSEYSGGNWSRRGGEEVEPPDQTPLHIAVEREDETAVDVLLTQGANPNIEDFDGKTALHLAVEAGSEGMVSALLAAGANASAPNRDWTSALHHTSQRGPLPMLKLLVDHKANVLAVNQEAWQPLHLAARAGREDKVAALLAAGADPRAANNQGNTPLHLAAVNGHAPVVKALLAAGADAALRNNEGRTPLDMAKNDGVRDLLRAA